MLLWTNLLIASRALFANKMRLVLTMLGIIIGVAAVIAMLAIGDGAREATMARFRAQGVNLLVLTNSWSRARRQLLQIEEWQLIQNLTEYVEIAAPEVRDGVRVRHGNENAEFTLVGTTPDYFMVRNVPLESGEIFNWEQYRASENVCVIGSKVAEDLFAGENPINQNLYAGNRSLLVLGVAAEKGEGWVSPDSRIFAPMPLVMNRIIGQDFIDGINIRARAHALVPEAQAALTALMRRHRGLTPAEEDNFRFFAMREIMDEMERQSGVLKALLGGVAAVSLLVGGIGIMNIMLVTVTERTREIGIRKALGARRRDILFQFIVESLFVSVIGAGIGVGLGIGIAKGFNRVFDQFEPLITSDAILLAVSCACIIGLIFGIYPAQRAAKLDPIEALRHE